ncbi:MAG TPA: hypothetical protein VK177_17715 [Flavobacteriales bacterium]|nr:hypothetical protein [Flavobacteriales bacterium]
MRQYAFIFLCVLCSCAGTSRESDIKTLDSLKNEVMEIKDAFPKLDTTLTANINQEVSAQLKVLKSVYMPDSIDIDVADLINNYQAFRKEHARFKMQRIRIKREIPYTISQLDALITDLKNKSLGKKDAQKFVETETKAATTLIKLFTDLNEQLKAVDSAFTGTRVKMNRFIDSLAADSANIQAIRLKLLKARTKRRK